MGHEFGVPEARTPTVWIIGGEGVHLRIPLMKRLREHGFEMAAVGSDERPEFRHHGFPFFRYTLSRSFDPLADRRTQRELFQLFLTHRPNLVHAVNTKPALLAPSAALAANTKCVRTITGLGSVFSSNSALALGLRPLYRHVQRRASMAATTTVFQNSDDRDYFLRKKLVSPGADRLVLSSGIDVDGFLCERGPDQALAELKRSLGLDGKVVVTMVSRLFKAKGVEEFLEAAKLVRGQLPEVAFLMAGPIVSDGPMAVSPDLISRSSDNVVCLGLRKDVADLLAISDMFALPSYLREGVPRVLLEAGAMSLPLVTTDMPGCREVVRDGWNGLLVRPRDARDLAQAILDLANSQTRRELMGKRSQAHVRETFDLTKVADAYAEIYREALQELKAPVTQARRAA